MCVYENFNKVLKSTPFYHLFKSVCLNLAVIPLNHSHQEPGPTDGESESLESN